MYNQIVQNIIQNNVQTPIKLQCLAQFTKFEQIFKCIFLGIEEHLPKKRVDLTSLMQSEHFLRIQFFSKKIWPSLVSIVVSRQQTGTLANEKCEESLLILVFIVNMNT